MDVGILILRVVIGALLFGHGAQKLFGWFGGHGLEGTGGFFDSLGYRPGRAWAGVAGLTEAGAGLMLLTGFLTPLAAAGVVGVMVNAIWTVKRPMGLFNGYELDLVYLTGAVALAFTGAGVYSVDGAFGWAIDGIIWGATALILGAVTGLFTLAIRRPPVPVAAEEESRRAA